MLVTLSDSDLKYAVQIARKRNESHRKGNRADGKVVSDSIGIDIQGAKAELAVARTFNLDWDGSFRSLDEWYDWRENGHDVSGLEVRSTHHPRGCLILHKSDKDDAPYILVIANKKATCNLCELVGWIQGKEGKHEDYWGDVGYNRPCYMVPQEELRPIDELVEGPKFEEDFSDIDDYLDKIEKRRLSETPALT